MNGISTASATNLQHSERCFVTKEFITKVDTNNFSPGFAFRAEKPARINEELKLKRLAAFGRSFTGQSWG